MRRITLLAILAVAVGGCGASDEQRVRTTLDHFTRAAADRDYQALCGELLSRDLVARVEEVGLPCEVALSKALQGVAHPRLDVRKVRIDGSTAFALVRTTARGQRASTDTVRLSKENGSWRIASLAGTGPPSPHRDAP